MLLYKDQYKRIRCPLVVCLETEFNYAPVKLVCDRRECRRHSLIEAADWLWSPLKRTAQRKRNNIESDEMRNIIINITTNHEAVCES